MKMKRRPAKISEWSAGIDVGLTAEIEADGLDRWTGEIAHYGIALREIVDGVWELETVGPSMTSQVVTLHRSQRAAIRAAEQWVAQRFFVYVVAKRASRESV